MRGVHLESLRIPVMTVILRSFWHLKNKCCKLVLYAAENQKDLKYSSSLTSSFREEQEEKETTKGTVFTRLEDFYHLNCTI